jgi:D-alanyl-D-alanine carboxypeptidase
MKMNLNSKAVAIMCIIGAYTMVSCNPNNSGNIETEIDSTELYRDEPMEQFDTRDNATGAYSDELSTRNAVKVDVNLENINWDAFRQQYDAPENVEQTSVAGADNFVTGPWTDFEDYSYRLVYRLEEDALWLQTFLRIDDDNAHLDPSANIQVLSMEMADSLKLGTLWSRMEVLGTRLEDSLNVTRPNPRQ